MENTELEQQYLHEAASHVGELFDETETAKAMSWISYGLNMREAEVAALKARITELEG